MRSPLSIAIYVLSAFFVLTLGASFFVNRNFPVLIVAGESSVGTWMSGILLSCCAAFSLVLTMHRGWYPWVMVALFFFMLAADEHFMFHERLKEWITFSFKNPSVLIRELPVFVGAFVGAWVSYLLWGRVKAVGRALLLGAVLFGIASVLLDVAGGAALWEECFKLTGEFLATCSLMLEVGTVGIKTNES